MEVQLAGSDLQIFNCFPVVVQLRPHLQQDTFVDRVQRQMQEGYQLAFIQAQAEVVAIAGFRMIENLSWGKILYVDDLVVSEQARSQGYGEQLLQWLMEYGKQQQCEQLHLDSGVQRFAAHRFYFRQRLTINSYHFAVQLASPD
ncbi:MAG: GNAT family N-acetyltransferase [Leptolyngbyaceae cyanobacterium SL_7_1]|nr:GNAT family N-acetyltransferase [Leptolyngbyaceae cyanobacterium SL_7_1]